MSTRPAGRRWYQFSLRRLLLVPLMLALALVPVAWVSRERQQLLRARNEALRAVILAERYRAELKRREAAVPATPRPADPAIDAAPQSPRPADGSAVIEQLQRENAELKATIERLRREVDRLEARARRSS